MSSADRDPVDIVETFASAKHPHRPVARRRPEGASDALVRAVGKLSEALEAVEDARGHLYAFHRLCGRADLTLQEAVRALRDAGQPELAAQLDDVLVGRDVLDGKWSFEIVEGYDAQYWSVFRAVEELVRRRLMDGRPHVYEAEMKHEEQRGRVG
jgi:hypothetical protein